MNIAQNARYRDLLEMERQRAQAQIARPLPTTMTSPQADALDCAADLSLWTIAQATHLAAKRRLIQVEIALSRLSQGTYGVCVKCRRSIDPERLDAIPAATLCVDCQRQAERQS